jgi:exopolysaccharide biosynthesis polyprenyl glycosylphosphotransferase
VLLVSKTLGLYDRDENVVKKTTLDEAPALFHVATLYAFVIWLCESYFVNGELGTGQVIGLWGLLFLSMLVGRMAARALTGRTVALERCIVVGDVGSAERVRRKFEMLPGVRATIVGRVPIRSEEGRSDSPPDLPFGAPPVLGDLDALGLVLVEEGVERVVIAPGAADSRDVLNVVRLVKSMGVRVSMLPRLTEVVGSSVEFDDLEGLTMLGLRRYGLSRSSAALKRAMDLVVALLILAVLAPVVAAIALAVKLTSPGPVLFRQRRIGMEGKSFEMLKFRSMRQGAELDRHELEELNEADEGLFKIADDPRLTTVGRFIRMASLDELPQLLNVVRGEMSLVGPRPLVPDEDRRVLGLDRRRLHVMPGITGVWQIYGSSRVPMREMVTVDYLYGANWSLWLDVKILLRTVPHAIGLRNL